MPVAVVSSPIEMRIEWMSLSVGISKVKVSAVAAATLFCCLSFLVLRLYDLG